MTPEHQIDYPRLLELSWEFSRRIEALHALYIDSVVGFKTLHSRLLSHQDDVKKFLGDHDYARTEFQDRCLVSYQELADRDEHLVSMSSVMNQGDVKERVRQNGQNTLLLGSQVVVSAYSG